MNTDGAMCDYEHQAAEFAWMKGVEVEALAIFYTELAAGTDPLPAARKALSPWQDPDWIERFL